MADTDIAIGLPEMTIDFNPGAGGTQRLPRVVGVGRAMQMMLEGRTLSPREALDSGSCRRSCRRPGEGGRDPDRRAAGASLAARDPIAEARRLRGGVAAVGTRPRDRAEVVHGLLGRSLLAGEDGRDDETGRGRWALAVGHAATGLLPWQEGTAAEPEP